VGGQQRLAEAQVPALHSGLEEAVQAQEAPGTHDAKDTRSTGLACGIQQVAEGSIRLGRHPAPLHEPLRCLPAMPGQSTVCATVTVAIVDGVHGHTQLVDEHRCCLSGSVRAHVAEETGQAALVWPDTQAQQLSREVHVAPPQRRENDALGRLRPGPAPQEPEHQPPIAIQPGRARRHVHQAPAAATAHLDAVQVRSALHKQCASHGKVPRCCDAQQCCGFSPWQQTDKHLVRAIPLQAQQLQLCPSCRASTGGAGGQQQLGC